jgi:hypothetical protein
MGKSTPIQLIIREDYHGWPGPVNEIVVNKENQKKTGAIGNRDEMEMQVLSGV